MFAWFVFVLTFSLSVLLKFLSQQYQSPILSAMQESTQVMEHFNELRIFHKDPDSSQDNQRIEGTFGNQSDTDECCVEAEVKESSEENYETTSTASEEKHLLAELN